MSKTERQKDGRKLVTITLSYCRALIRNTSLCNHISIFCHIYGYIPGGHLKKITPHKLKYLLNQLEHQFIS